MSTTDTYPSASPESRFDGGELHALTSELFDAIDDMSVAYGRSPLVQRAEFAGTQTRLVSLSETALVDVASLAVHSSRSGQNLSISSIELLRPMNQVDAALLTDAEFSPDEVLRTSTDSFTVFDNTPEPARPVWLRVNWIDKFGVIGGTNHGRSYSTRFVIELDPFEGRLYAEERIEQVIYEDDRGVLQAPMDVDVLRETSPDQEVGANAAEFYGQLQDYLQQLTDNDTLFQHAVQWPNSGYSSIEEAS